MISVTNDERKAAVMRFCPKCDRFTAQIPYNGRKYKLRCVRCGKKLTKVDK